MVIGLSPILCYPEDQFRFPFAWEDALTHGGAESAIQATVGHWAYNTRPWESIADTFNASPEVAARQFRMSCAGGRRKTAPNIDVDDVQLVVLKGVPTRLNPHAPPMHGLFGMQRRYLSSSGAQALNQPAAMAYIYDFANRSCALPILAAEEDARKECNTYLLELDKETICAEDTSRNAAQWESSAVLLRVRIRGPLVLTAAVVPKEDASRAAVSFTDMAGNELAVLPVDADCTCAKLRDALVQQLAVPEKCIKVVLPGGTVLGRKHDNLIVGALRCDRRMSPPVGTLSQLHAGRRPSLKHRCR